MRMHITRVDDVIDCHTAADTMNHVDSENDGCRS